MTTDGADSYQAGEAHELDSLMRLVSGLVLPCECAARMACR